MKILQISSAQTLGGGERHLADLTNALVRRGHDVFIALREGAAVESELDAVPRENAFKLPLRNSLDVASARSLAKIVRANGIEIVHAHMGRDYPLAAFAVRNSKARLIVTRHVMFPLGRLHKFILAGAARVIAVSTAVAEQLKSDHLVDPNKIVVVLNGIETDRFAGAKRSFNRTEFFKEWKLPFDCRLVGTVGELTQLKGHIEFLQAAAEIATQFPQTYFLVAGVDYSTEGAYRREVEATVKRFNLEERVRMIGWLDELPNLYCAVDVFVSASKSESFGLAIAEAMASGAAVVATETDGARELIQSGETGLLVPVDDVKRMADALVRLLTDENYRKRLGVAAQRTANEKFNIDRMVSETEQVYRDALLN